MPSRPQRGMTLVEVLIAVMVTAIIATLSYASIDTVIRGAESLKASGSRTQALNQALVLLDRDLLQFVPRPVRDEFGNLQPALTGGELALYPLSLTRDGWHNSLYAPRSELQRVHYYLEDDVLWRAYSPTLDRAVDVELSRLRLLDGVEALELRFLESLDTLRVDRQLSIDTRDWVDSWIVPGGGSPNLEPPMAIELTLQLVDLGAVRRFYVLPRR